MLERKPPRIAKPSEAALKVGAELYSVFRRFVPLEGPLTAAAVAAISEKTGLGTRRIREFARRFRSKPIAESLASLPKGPKPGKKHASAAVIEVIDREIVEIFLKRPPPAIREAANQIRGLLIADTGDHRFDMADVPSVRTIERMIGEISSPQLARVVQMDHSPANVMLVDSLHRNALGRPWVTLLIDVWSRCILGFYVSFGDPSIFRCGRAVANALLPKKPLLTGLQMTEDYPMHGFFKRLHADFASALKRSEAPATHMGSIRMSGRVGPRTWAGISSD